jgi:hypothetical protein
MLAWVQMANKAKGSSKEPPKKASNDKSNKGKGGDQRKKDNKSEGKEKEKGSKK